MKYPIYIPSAGRMDVAITPALLARYDIPHFLVVQPCQSAEYRRNFPKSTLLILPWDNNGRKDGLLRARNWIRDHAEAAGHAKHWQLDDNIREYCYRHKGLRVPCHPDLAFSICEQFSDKFQNIGLSGPLYTGFSGNSHIAKDPYIINHHVYSTSLINHSCPCRWRLNYNDDTDLCLQIIAAGWCTVTFCAVLQDKAATMTIKGGNTDDLYKIADGRLKMAKTLERIWPGIVTVKSRWGRPQHVIRNNWRDFVRPLIPAQGVANEPFPEMMMRIVGEVKSSIVKRTVKDFS